MIKRIIKPDVCLVDNSSYLMAKTEFNYNCPSNSILSGAGHIILFCVFPHFVFVFLLHTTQR